MIRRLESGPLDPGRHEIRWDGRDMQGHAAANGTYFCRATWNGEVVFGQMQLIR
ncbi:MAG: FlgD immunoglobulin-like domain containing protein [Candidatus Eisenbacteria bacterium]